MNSRINVDDVNVGDFLYTQTDKFTVVYKNKSFVYCKRNGSDYLERIEYPSIGTSFLHAPIVLQHKGSRLSDAMEKSWEEKCRVNELREIQERYYAWGTLKAQRNTLQSTIQGVQRKLTEVEAQIKEEEDNVNRLSKRMNELCSLLGLCVEYTAGGYPIFKSKDTGKIVHI